MRVVMLSWEYPPRIVGGISPHVSDLSKQLVQRGLEVHVITKAAPELPLEEVDAGGVRVHRVEIGREAHNFVHEIQLLNKATDLRCRQLLEQWREGGDPIIFHAHDWLSLDAARELKYEYKLPMLSTVHATESGRHGGIHNDLQRYIHEQEYWLTYESWRVIVCSEFMRGEVERLFSCPGDKVDVIYNGVDATKFDFDWPDSERTEFRNKYAKPDEPIVMYVGRFVREKGVQVLLNAASAILAENPKTRFLVVGGGDRTKFERFVRWAGLQDRVTFTGFMRGRPLQQLYRCADVAVFPSLYEPFGIVALEAMAAGASVVSSDAGGLREVVLHGQTGTTHYAGNPESLAWAVNHVLQNPDQSSSMRNAAVKRLGSDFSWPRLAELTHQVYDRIWAEFLGSFWAEETLWPVSEGARERAEASRVKQKAAEGGYSGTPSVTTHVPLPVVEAISPDKVLRGIDETEEGPVEAPS